MQVEKLLKIIDAISRIQRLMIYPLIALVFVTCADVFARNVVGSPLIWGFDVELQLFAALITLCWAYSEHRGAHVRITIVPEALLSRRGQEVLSVITYLLFLFPFAIVLFIQGMEFAWDSWRLREISITTPWQPIIYHVKAMIPLASLFLILQLFASTLRHLIAAIEAD
ncbi:MAG: TRAP transporter small permease subunit [Albidovulum sp.]|nr:TRAP transporter small permease subunit [Albidovulum sp.]MDE0306794.1 TRAP transporter small permease subunit [Albidovulum sp.]MDE0530668.1 TRAP transporter small permease subunit [Albidovulum sp.]